MCGICGIINFNNKPVKQPLIRKRMKKIKHRGPDDEGIYIDNNVGFGFVRLSILDLSYQGHQPMLDDNGRYIIIHNGEVYNYIEIREELKKIGHKFKSNTDTEVILKSYIEWGINCLNKFNGMWAFAIYDKKVKKVLISRDRYGIKPFYYFINDEQFIFASEIPAILSVLKHKLKANNQAIFDYLVFNRSDHTEQTFFKEINKLQHGHNISLQIDNHHIQSINQKIKIEQWYNLPERVKKGVQFKNPQEYQKLLSSAIGLRLRSDVPIGVCLSGGLDSSSIVATLLNDYKKDDLNTFSAVYGYGVQNDESEFIKLFSKSIKNMYFTTPSAESLAADIPRFIKAHGEPVPSTSPYAQFKVMQLAQKNVVVTLDGQGADEQLAGYHYFFGYFFKGLLKQLSLLKLLKEIFYYIRLHKSLYGLKTFIYFLLPSKLRTSIRVNEKGYLVDHFVNKYSSNSIIASRLYNSQSLHESLLDHFEYKLEHLLKWEDKNSMFFSLESRVPFLDYRLVEKTLASSKHKMINNGWTKYILREAMKGILVDDIRFRKDDVGFGTPESNWFKEEYFQNYFLDIIHSDSFKERKIIDTLKASELLKKHLNGKAEVSKEIWKIINLELWFREFID